MPEANHALIENQLLLLLVSLAFQAVMAVAMTVIGLLARRSLASVDAITAKLEELRVLVAGDYYSRKDHDRFEADIRSGIAAAQEYAREGLHKQRIDLTDHEIWIRLLAQHASLVLPAKKGGG